jgi:hypothetical protein
MFTSKVMLQSCGIVAGIAFGFLGFCLFLMWIEGQIDAELTNSDGIRLNVTRLAPGAFILMLATILIGVCGTTRIPVSLDTRSTPVLESSTKPLTREDRPPALDSAEPGSETNALAPTP